ncbi:hypothetical protein BP6252_00663 [Coleophoma cylindrospora]|uniref:Uncharacterized protein n=1 Tax=Coleophoma cylindrospora TaxID=1849047 RepID=A0A3D8SR32_9HELO|nr:hypothetical protein BP6252_00663 [Coleophoma cylindrospora]
MQTSRCISSTASALHRVFVIPTEQLQRTAYMQSSALRPTPNTFASKLLVQHQRRYASMPSTARRLPRNEEIKAWSVSLRNAEGKLDPPRSTADILKSIDRSSYSLVTIVAGSPGVPPICKVVSMKDEYKAAKAKQKQAKNPGATTKEVELNWAIDENDLGHRMDRVKEFLGKGYKVEVLLAKKRKGKAATLAQALGVVQRIRDTIASVEGAKESKPMEGKVLETATIFAEGKVPKVQT